MASVVASLVISLLCVHLVELKAVGPTWLNRFLVFAERFTLRKRPEQKDLLLPNRSPLGTITLPPSTEKQVELLNTGPTGYT